MPTNPPLPTPVELATIAAPLWAAESTPRGEIALKQAYALWQEAHRFLQEQRQKQQAHSMDHDE